MHFVPSISLYTQHIPQPTVEPVQDRLGYECEFSETPPSAFQTECPVCLQILRKPHEATCCGNAFCHTCVLQAQKKSSCCPSCKTTEYTVFHSKGLERSLKQLHVCCQYRGDGCKWTGELGQYDSHLNLNSQVEERMIGCLYAKIQCHNRCGEAIPRQHLLLHEMEECSHKQDDHAQLEVLLHSYIPKLMQEMSRKDDRIAELESELTSKTKVHPTTPGPDESPGQKVTHEVSQNICELESDLTTLKEEMNPITPDPDEAATVIPVQRTIPNFTKMQKLNQDYVSEPFYTHPEGYKMCLWVFPNGYGKAENTHASLFTCFMKGENDKKLKWPFCGNITVQLLDQVRNRDHRERVINYDGSNSSYAKRVTVGDKSEGWGVFELISLESLRNPACQFLKDDCLKIRITKVEFDKRKTFFKRFL